MNARRIVLGVFVLVSPYAHAHFVGFKSPGAGMHFSEGQSIVVFADMFDDNNEHGIIACPAGQTVNDMHGAPGPATCSAGGMPSGWPQLQVLVDGVVQVDGVTHGTTVRGTTNFDGNMNPDPINFYRFSIEGLAPGSHAVTLRGHFAPPPDSDNATLDSDAITVYVDALPASRTVLSLTSDLVGAVNWHSLIVKGNGHSIHLNGGAITVVDTLVTGLGSATAPGISGSSTAIDIRQSVFESTGAVDLTASAAAVISDNEFRSNNLLKFEASDPEVPRVITLHSSASTSSRVFQGNRIGAGRVVFSGAHHWTIGGDTDATGNILIGPRVTLNLTDGTSNVDVRGNYIHHNYRGGWSQGFNLTYCCNAAGNVGILVEHNLFRGSSWPVQDVTGEFRYNLVFGYGHTWLRSAADGARIHHNVFAPEAGGGDLDQGLWFYGGESNVSVFNNTFDGGGRVAGIFAGPTLQVNGVSRVTSFRNNLVTFSRDQGNDNPGAPRIVGDAGTLTSADYNAFYSPDNANHDNYDVAGMSEPALGAHDVSSSGIGQVDKQLGATPFAGQRVYPYDTVVDEAAVWQRSQPLSAILHTFRTRYMPAVGSPIINAGDPQDNDSIGRRTDIGAIDAAGHDADRFGLFGGLDDLIFRSTFE
jgi:hypothetical protein